MDTDLKAKVVALAKSHPIPSDDKLERRMKRIDRMTSFYQDKAPEAPEKQSLMFVGFVSALIYTRSLVKMYRSLTEELAELAQGVDNNEEVI